jgi:hypothetical protein
LPCRGRPIKFDGKAGKWLFSDTDEEIDPSTDFVALRDGMAKRCRLKWTDY